MPAWQCGTPGYVCRPIVVALATKHGTLKMDAPIKKAYSVPECMCVLGICRDHLYRLIREGRLPARKIGRRTVVLETDLQGFLEAFPRLGGGAL